MDYFSVTTQFNKANYAQLKPRIDEIATLKFSCLGIVEDILDESELDEILGVEDLCGQSLSPEKIEAIESHISCQDNFSVHYNFDQEHGEGFYNFLCQEFPQLETANNVVADQDWNESWRKNFQPIEVERGLRVMPSWMESSQSDISIYPGMGFGTGDHETTYLCLKTAWNFFKETPEKVATILDFGCGSGILGIMAEKRFNSHVVYCDIDDDALENCQQNYELNFSKITPNLVKPNELFFEQDFDLIFANIVLNTLVENKSKLEKMLKREGYLILSGFYVDQLPEVLQAYSSLTVVSCEERNNWCSLLLQK